MGITLIVYERFGGTRSAIDLFADLAAQILQNRRGFVWTRTHPGDILKAPAVKSHSVLSVTGGTHDAPI